MTRLSPQEVLSRAPSLAQEFSNRHHCVVVLKSASTIIASPECPLLYYSGGHPGLAKAGSGDVLAGMIASFRAQGLDTETAAAMGVTLHGEMAKKCEARLSARAMFPHDILQDLCMYFTEKNM
jgi:NAD(P)H-hydrate epimerase